METPKQVSCLEITVTDFNPNHRVRFLALDEPLRYLFDLASSVSDDSFYMAPKLERAIGIQVGNAGPIRSSGAEETHISFHASGAVNLHVAAERQALRRACTGRGQNGLAARFIFNSVDCFKAVTAAEVNSLPGRYTQIPVVGVLEKVPVCLDVYQVGPDSSWQMPWLSDFMQIHVSLTSPRKASIYHFLVWQHTRAERHAADLVIR